MKRFMAVLLIGLFSFALVAGCGKKQEEQPAVEQTTPPDTGAAPAADTAATEDTSAIK